MTFSLIIAFRRVDADAALKMQDAPAAVNVKKGLQDAPAPIFSAGCSTEPHPPPPGPQRGLL